MHNEHSKIKYTAIYFNHIHTMTWLQQNIKLNVETEHSTATVSRCGLPSWTISIFISGSDDDVMS